MPRRLPHPSIPGASPAVQANFEVIDQELHRLPVVSTAPTTDTLTKGKGVIDTSTGTPRLVFNKDGTLYFWNSDGSL